MRCLLLVLLIGCFCFVGCGSDSDWAPETLDTSALAQTADIDGFSRRDENRILKALAICQVALKDSAYESPEKISDAKLVAGALSGKYRPLTQDYLDKHREVDARGSIDFATGYLLLKLDSHVDAFDLALTILHETGHSLRDEDVMKHGDRDLEVMFVLTKIERVAHREERRLARLLFDYVTKDFPENSSWRHTAKTACFTARMNELCNVTAHEFADIAMLTDARRKDLEASLPQEHSKSEEWQAANVVHGHAFAACKIRDLGRIIEQFEGTVELYEQLETMNSMFRDLGPSDLAKRTQAARQQVETFRKAFEFMRNRRIENTDSLGRITIEEIEAM